MRITRAQRRFIRVKSKVSETRDTTGDELNIIPFLDVVVNIIMFLLMSMASVSFFSQAEATLPGHGPLSSADGLRLSVTVAEGGIIVAGSGGKLASGCVTTEAGRATTVPRTSAGYDWGALTACVSEVKREFPNETQVTISGDPRVTYQDIISAMDAVRSNGDLPLFADVRLSAGLR